MRRTTTCILLASALAVVAVPAPADAQNPVIEKILFSVQDIETKEILTEIPANGDLVLEVGDRVRLRAIAVPAGKNRPRRYPSTSYELGNPAGLVSMSRMNAELGSTDLEVHRAFNPSRPDAVPFLRFKILEELKMGPRMSHGNIYIRLQRPAEPEPEPTPQTQEPETRRGITLYEHQDFRGRSERFLVDDPRLNDNYLRHDMASSVRVDLGCKVTLYEHPDYQGRATVLTEDVTDLNGTRVGNDSVSSLRIDCSEERYRYEQRERSRDRSYRERRGVTLFEHSDFRGRSETFYEDDSYLNDNLIRHDSASSLRVDPGCSAILYEHPDYDGRASVLSEDVTYLSETRVGNDTVSSIEVRCDGYRSSRNDGTRGGTGRQGRYNAYDRSGPGVTLYEHQNFRGRSEFFADDDERLNDNVIRHDSASSVHVDAGCEAILYEHPDFQGRATVVTRDLTDLNGTRVGNDSVSSIEVVCRPRRY